MQMGFLGIGDLSWPHDGGSAILTCPHVERSIHLRVEESNFIALQALVAPASSAVASSVAVAHRTRVQWCMSHMQHVHCKGAAAAPLLTPNVSLTPF